jgi:hypothetical protein
MVHCCKAVSRRGTTQHLAGCGRSSVLLRRMAWAIGRPTGARAALRATPRPARSGHRAHRGEPAPVNGGIKVCRLLLRRDRAVAKRRGPVEQPQKGPCVLLRWKKGCRICNRVGPRCRKAENWQGGRRWRASKPRPCALRLPYQRWDGSGRRSSVNSDPGEPRRGVRTHSRQPIASGRRRRDHRICRPACRRSREQRGKRAVIPS